MAAKQGSLTINSENIFPIIKKWLYSDHDIFFRELISNGCDAVTKLKKLSMVGEFEEPEDNHYRVDVVVSPENKTVQFIDNGLGMTEDEVNEYICQIAFSGAADFLEKYKDKANDDQIIGHFGLGFYSAFMVADKVTIETLSYKEGAEPVYWECDNGTEYTISKGDKTDRGTVITLYLNEDSYEFANEYRAKEVIQKYCSFMPIEIYFTNADAPEETDLHPVCGNFLEEAVLPDGLQVIGSCAFYNCRKLRRLSFGAADLTVGSDVFLNCFALADLVMRAEPEAATGLFALVNNITEAVRALFWLPGEAAPRAGLWYPAYWEDVEESPAHILLHTFSGQGYHYRQCFLNGKFLCAEYDAIFPEGHAAEDRNIMAMLCFDRLRWPWNLTEGAKAAYTAFLKANTGRVVARLLKAQDLDGLKALLALDVLDAAAFAEAAQMAAKADNAAAAALLADAEYTKLSAKPKKKRYDFDF